MNSNTLFLIPLVLALVEKQVICELVGAVYFMSNDPNGNSVITNGISSNGKLISSSTFKTGGNGGITDYSKTTFNGLDPLASQNSLIVSGNLLFAVNAGSNSISVFNIRKTDPICLTLISVVGSGGEFPISLAFSAKLELLCVLNGGRNNNLQCFRVPVKSPGQIEILHRFQYSFGFERLQIPPTLNYSLSDINFSPDSTQLFVAVKGNNQLSAKESGQILIFPNMNRNQLNPPRKIQPKGITNPFGFSIVPGTGDHSDSVLAYSDYGTVQGEEGGFGLVQIDRNGNIVGDAMFEIVSGQMAICWTVFSPRTGSLYLTDPLTNTLTEGNVMVNVNGEGLTANILTQHTVEGEPLDVTVASLRTMDILYVLAPGFSAIQVLEINREGEAKIIQTFDPVRNGAMVRLGRNMAGIAKYVIPHSSVPRSVHRPLRFPKFRAFHHDKYFFWQMTLFK